MRVPLILLDTRWFHSPFRLDEWGAFPLERQRLFDLIKNTNANGVLLLSGNVHFSELSKIDTDRYALYDFTASGMTHVNTAYALAPNRYRIAGPMDDHNTGLIEIDWDTAPYPTVRLKALGVDNIAGFTYQISLGDLQ